MAAYDNLLANVPTDLWIGGKWKKSSDGARFDVIDPATEQKIASVASASIDGRQGRADAAQGAFRPGPRRSRASAAKSSARPMRIIRDRRAVGQAHHHRERQGRCRTRGARSPYAAEFLPLVREEGVAKIWSDGMAPASGARMFVITSRPVSPCW